MSSKKLVTIIFGTRPEAIKLAPVIQRFRESNKFRTRVILTGQHKEMVSQVMNIFKISADLDLDLMKPSQTLTHITCAALEGLRKDFQENRPNMVLVQGDTTTAFAGALAAFYEERENIFDIFAQAGPIALTLNVTMMIIAYYLSRVFASGISQQKCIAIECGLQNGTLAVFVATQIFSYIIYIIPTAAYALIMYITAFIFMYIVKESV